METNDLESLKKTNAELLRALQQAKTVADIQCARIKRLEEQQNGFRPDFLLSGVRFKLNFSQRGNVDVFHNYAQELQGRWVALVPAEDDTHLARSAPANDGQLVPVAEVFSTTESFGEGDDARFYEGTAVRLLQDVPKGTKLYMLTN